MMTTIGDSPVVHAIGWAILQSLWQGTVVGLMTMLVLWTLRRTAAQVRYAAACVGLAVLVVSWTASVVGSIVDGGVSAADAGAASAINAVPVSPPATLEALGPPLPPVATPSLQPKWQQRLEAWSVAVVPIWLVGVCALSLRLLVGWTIVERVRRRAAAGNNRLGDEFDRAFLERVRILAARVRVGRPFCLVRSAAVSVPTVIGWIRPVILLPVNVVTGLTASQLDAVIAHELAHIRRHDYAVNIIQAAAEIVLFYHPACWWISRQIRREREHCCDDVAVAVCGDGVDYAAALAELESLRSNDATLGLAVTGGELTRRVKRLLAPAAADRPGASAWAGALVPVVALAVVAGAAFAGGKARAQTTTPTAARIIPANEAVVQGQVVDVRGDRPIAGAQVRLSRGNFDLQVTTDERGRYEAGKLGPGSYAIAVTATGYFAAEYGQRRPYSPAPPVDVPGGRITGGLDVRLQPLSVVSGRIFDNRGEGLAGVELQLVQAGRRSTDGGGGGTLFAQSEEGGTYRFREVMPGSYYVRAYVPSMPATQRPVGGDRTQLYAPTFYPSVPAAAEAQILRVDAGQELFDIDFALHVARARTIAGRLLDASGNPQGAGRVHLMGQGIQGTGGGIAASVDASGRFEFRDVVPGEYMVMAETANPYREFSGRWMSTTRTVTVTDADVRDLDLMERAGAQIDGQVVRDATAERTLDPRGVRVAFEQRNENGWHKAGAPPLGADGRFSMEAPAGPSSISIDEVPEPWAVKAITLDGSDITDGSIDFGTGRRRVMIVLTDRFSAVSGTVVDGRNRPAPSASVVIFADDASRWPTPTRYVRMVPVAISGQFSVEPMPPGDYLLVAAELLPQVGWDNPEMLDRLRPLAIRIRLNEGEGRVVPLRLSPTPTEFAPGF